jgi:chromosome segregation ATPase
MEGNDPEDFSKILEAFDDFGSEPKPPHPSHTRRHSTGVGSAKEHPMSQPRYKNDGRSSSRRVGSSSSSKHLSRDATGHSSRSHSSRLSKSNRSVPTSASSDDTSEGSPDIPLDKNNQANVLKVRNRALIHENRRLQELVSRHESRLGTGQEDLNAAGSIHTVQSANTNTEQSTTTNEGDGDGEESMSRLKSKIRALKTKRKQEKLTLLQMEKHVNAHASEIEGLQRELHRTVTELEKTEKERQDDKYTINVLSKKLTLAENQLNNKNKDAGLGRLKSDLKTRDGELGVTLELLQSKVERIIHLEYEVEKSNEKMLKAERRVEDLVKGAGAQLAGKSKSFQAMELLSAEAEINSLRRQNMMLKLVVEELQEARRRRSDSDIDIDSVFLKLPLDVRPQIPFSVGLEAVSLADGDDDHAESVLSFDTSDLMHLPKQDPDQQPKRPAR